MSPQFYSFHPSPTLRILIGLVHLAALVILLWVNFSIGYQISGVLFILLSWCWQLRRVTLRELLVQGDLLACLDSDNMRYQAALLASSWVGVDVIFLHLRDVHRQKNIIRIIVFDALSANDFRRLRVAIRLLVKTQ